MLSNTFGLYERIGMSKNINPCPFCGCDARLTYSTDNHRQPYVTCDTPRCPGCNTYQWHYHTKAEAIEAWNRRAERTVKVIEHDASVTDTDGYKYHRSEYLCGACKKKVLGGDEYCSHCGAKLDWSEE